MDIFNIKFPCDTDITSEDKLIKGATYILKHIKYPDTQGSWSVGHKILVKGTNAFNILDLFNKETGTWLPSSSMGFFQIVLSPMYNEL